jgi:hypothetical protein
VSSANGKRCSKVFMQKKVRIDAGQGINTDNLWGGNEASLKQKVPQQTNRNAAELLRF